MDNDTLALLRASTGFRDAMTAVVPWGRRLRRERGGVDACPRWMRSARPGGAGRRGRPRPPWPAGDERFDLATATEVAITAHLDRRVAERLGELAPLVFERAGAG